MSSDFLVYILLGSFVGGGVIAYLTIRKEQIEKQKGGDE